jgi:hypothetical protein
MTNTPLTEKQEKSPGVFFRASRNPPIWGCRAAVASLCVTGRHDFFDGSSHQGPRRCLGGRWDLARMQPTIAWLKNDRSGTLRTMAWLEVDDRISNHPPRLSPDSSYERSLLWTAGWGGTSHCSRLRGARGDVEGLAKEEN